MRIRGLQCLAHSVAVVSMVLVGCGGERESRQPPSAPERTGPQDPDRERIDRLRALGYVGFTDERVAEGEAVIPLHVPERTAPGYTLITSGDLALAQLFDAEGRVVHAWRGEPPETWSNAELLSDGSLLVPAMVGVKRSLLHLSWGGELLWRAEIRSHHDAELTPEGTVATLTNVKRRIPTISEDVDTKDHEITILSRDGELLERASIHDLLATAPELFEFQRVERMEENLGQVIDLLHCNSLEFMWRSDLAERDPIYATGNVLVSIRHQDTIAIFDWKAKRLVWAWGQGELSGQHDATVLANGNILVFDNGLARGWSRVVELDPLRRKIVWEYRAPDPEAFFSLRKGSGQRLPNGNTLIANSDSGEAFEVTAAGEDVWRFLNPNADEQGRRATIVRAKRYSSELVEGLLP